MKTFIIMCDGLGTRWITPEIKYKHLIPFDGIPLVFRTVQQLQKYPCNIVLVAPEEFKDYDHYPEGVFHTSLGYREAEPRTLLDGILRTKAFWTEDTTILLGDVVFSNKAIRFLMLTHNLYPRVLGRKGSNVVTGKEASELFSLSFNPKKDIVGAEIKVLLSRADKPNLYGKLWEYVHEYQIVVSEVNDYTDDIDSPQAYEQFYPAMLEAVRKDDYEQIP